MPQMYLTRLEEFCSSHRLHSPHLSDEENREVYGKCNNFNGHGHNYKLYVTIRGEVDPVTGMLLELGRFSKLIRKVIVDVVDHKNLNLDIKWLENTIPTAENLTLAFWKQLENELPVGELYELKLIETDRNIVALRKD
jgi:6-pyruvoyltetrahydropterin/6-carboxytetrahydropterin synthase